jgi:hypothetical protein
MVLSECELTRNIRSGSQADQLGALSQLSQPKELASRTTFPVSSLISSL